MQNRKFLSIRAVSFFGLFVFALCLLLYFYYAAFEHKYPASSKTLRFNYTVTNTSGEFIDHTDFAVKIPMAVNNIQSVISVNSSHKNTLITEENGGQHISFPLENISPYSSKLIDLTLVVNVSAQPKYERITTSNYQHSEKYIELESPAIKELAMQLKGMSQEETARNIYEWLVNNITHASYTADSKGAQYLVEKKTGDCTEFMYAFVALARANGVPARGVSGFWIPGESTIINAADYHDWAEFYDGDRWVLVDPMKQYFDSNKTDYLMTNLFTGNQNVKIRFDISDGRLSVGL